MNKLQIMNSVTRTFNRAGLQLKKHSPEILVVGGVIGGIASAIMACRATLKVNEVVEPAKETIEKIHVAVEKGANEAGSEYTQQDAKKDLTRVYLNAGLGLIKLYGPAVILGGLSVTSILASNNIMRKRNVALAAAYTAVDNSFKGYRNRVIDRFGEELDRELKYGIKAVEVEETVVDENGEEKVVKKTIEVAGPALYSQYSKVFDNGCKGWEKDSDYNRMYLTNVQSYLNEKLRAEGHLFLNEVYDELGIPRTKAGQMVGWIYDEKNPTGDNYVDFGLDNIHIEQVRDFINGYENVIILDFNVDGIIYDLIEK